VLAELRRAAVVCGGATPATPLRVALRRIIARMHEQRGEDARRVVSYLRGIEVEAAREEARALAEVMISLDEDESVVEHAGSLEYDPEGTEQEPIIELEAEPVPVDLDVIAVARAA